MFHVSKKDLRDFTTTEKDMKKGTSKFPTHDYRVSQGEDLFAQTASMSHSASVVAYEAEQQDDGVFAGSSTGADDLHAQQKMRGKQLTADANFD